MDYVELKCRTHYSFLRGASHPKELIDQAVKLGLKGLAITDLNGVYGLPKAYIASKSYSNFKLISGAEVKLEGSSLLTLLCPDRSSYGLLCRILTQAHSGKSKGDAYLQWNELVSFLDKSPEKNLIAIPSLDSQWNWKELKDLFGDGLYIPLIRALDGKDKKRTEHAKELSHSLGAQIVATNDVYYHDAYRRDLQDVLTSIREGKKLDDAGFLLFSNQERYLKSPQQMMSLYEDIPSALSATLEISDRCRFSLSELKYRYPSEWIPVGHSAQSYLVELVKQGTHRRYPEGIPTSVEKQLEYELLLIKQLQFADYFLTIWEIVEFAKMQNILCQGRGSAANSIVCYVLGITAIDPVQMDLLFERFISVERGEPPDIDVDFEHERREEVIQHIYKKYGRDRAAMVSAVITYRSRSAIREVTKVFGRERDKREFLKHLEASDAPASVHLQKKLINELQDFPRHLSIHSGGFTLSADPIIETVPVEPARMEGRTIIQWDKYDLDILGLLKIDILALGMLTTLKKTLNLVGNLTLDTIPKEDEETYKMIQNADTVGTFQIESRAQISMLPRLLPKNFYDLVIEVALVRPGPITGKMVHPYLKRRKGIESVTYPDLRLKPILEKTLGVPLFQEQVMKIAIHLADFTPGESDQLRRAIGAWRSSGSLDQMGKRLMQGLLANGIPNDFAMGIFQQIQGFAEYGFPESHAASFALLAYASAYLKCHYPAEFLCALLNSQPMGFYAPHTLIDDAKRHGVKVSPIHPLISEWDCKMEESGVRLGFRYVSSVSKKEVKNLLREREKRKFSDLPDFIDRCGLRQSIIYRLAMGNAFSCFGMDQRTALWEVLAYLFLNRTDATPVQLNLFSKVKTSRLDGLNYSFERMDEYETIHTDYTIYGFSTHGHPMQAIRKKWNHLPRITAFQAKQVLQGRVIQIPGLSVVMQRPPTAAGTVFATLEDETGFLDLIIHKDTFLNYKEMILDHCFLIVTGRVQRDGLSVSLVVQSLKSFIPEVESDESSKSSFQVKRLVSEGVRG